MSEAELIFTALAELSTRQIAETDEAKGYSKMLLQERKVARLQRMQGLHWKIKQEEK